MMNRSGTVFNTSETQIHGGSNLAQKYKLVFLGDQSVGKTSIINRFIFDTFDGKDHPTVGIDFITKTLYFDEKAIKLQLWDTAGQERFRSLIPSYIRDCTVAIIVYDITSPTSFNSVNKWIEDARAERGNDVIIIVIGNKTDLEAQRTVTRQQAEEYARENETIYIEVSAKNGDNVHNLFNMIASILLGSENRVLTTEQNFQMYSTPNVHNGNNINLTSRNPEDEEEFQKKKNCSC